MILVALVISTVAFFLCFNLLNKNKALHIISSLFFLVVFLLSTLFITLNFHNHLGMHKVYFEKKSSLVSSITDNTNDALIHANLGKSGKDQIFFYRTNKKQNKLQYTGTDKVNNVVVANAKTPKLVTKTFKYEYKTSMDRFWFAWAQKPTRVKTVNYFYVPKNWAKGQVKSEAVAKDYVNASVKRAMMANPNMSSNDMQQAIKNAELKYKNMINSQIVPILKNIDQKLKQS